MKITTTWFGDQFNVDLAAVEGREPFLQIKGCRIVNGSKGEFVSWPATKNQNTGKYWNHAYASEPFNAAVLAEAKKSAPAPKTHGEMKRGAPVEADDDIPF